MENFYDPGTLEYGTLYYWRIVAWDSHGASTEGPLWHFSTEEESLPDLDCTGSLSWDDVSPGDRVTGSFTVSNIGDAPLDWEITEHPEWGEWSFDPISGTGLPAGDSIIIDVELTAPDEENTEFEGEVQIDNSWNSSDFCVIPVYLKTPYESEVMWQPWVSKLFQHLMLGRIYLYFA
jgi:hypothetical protein